MAWEQENCRFTRCIHTHTFTEHIPVGTHLIFLIYNTLFCTFLSLPGHTPQETHRATMPVHSCTYFASQPARVKMSNHPCSSSCHPQHQGVILKAYPEQSKERHQNLINNQQQKRRVAMLQIEGNICAWEVVHARSQHSRYVIPPLPCFWSPRKQQKNLQESYESLWLYWILQVSFCAGSPKVVQAAATTGTAADEGGEQGSSPPAPGESAWGALDVEKPTLPHNLSAGAWKTRSLSKSDGNLENKIWLPTTYLEDISYKEPSRLSVAAWTFFLASKMVYRASTSIWLLVLIPVPPPQLWQYNIFCGAMWWIRSGDWFRLKSQTKEIKVH